MVEAWGGGSVETIDEQEEREILEWSLGEYDNGETGCSNCGRHRLCICTNGMHRCEKCNYSPELSGYAPAHLA